MVNKKHEGYEVEGERRSNVIQLQRESKDSIEEYTLGNEETGKQENTKIFCNNLGVNKCTLHSKLTVNGWER